MAGASPDCVLGQDNLLSQCLSSQVFKWVLAVTGIHRNRDMLQWYEPLGLAQTLPFTLLHQRTCTLIWVQNAKL